MHLKVFGKNGVAHEIHDHPVTCRRNHHRDNGQAIKPVRHVNRVACPHNHKHADENEETAKGNEYILEERHRERARQWLVADPHEAGHGNSRNQEFDEQPHLSGKTLGRGARDFQKIIIETDCSKSEGDEKHRPDIKIAEIGP